MKAFKKKFRNLTKPENYCEKCGEKYPNINYKWCRLCQTSGNEQIDDFIQELQLKTNWFYDDIGFKWIPYNQFSSIKEIGKAELTTVYSAIWKDGPLKYDVDVHEWTRMPRTII